MQETGAPQDVIDKYVAEAAENQDEDADQDEGEFCLWKEHARPLALFLAAQDCWVHAGMDGRPVRFDPAAAEKVWTMSGQRVRPSVFTQVQVIAEGALMEMQRVLNEKTEKVKR